MIEKITSILLTSSIFLLITPHLQGQINSPFLDYRTISPSPYSQVENILKKEKLNGGIKSIKKIEHYSSVTSFINKKFDYKYKLEPDECFEIDLNDNGEIIEFNKLNLDSLVANTYYYNAGMLDSYLDFANNNVTKYKIYTNKIGKIEKIIWGKTGPYIHDQRKDSTTYSYNYNGWLTSHKNKGQITVYNYLQDTFDFERLTYYYNRTGDSLFSSKINIIYTDPHTKTFSKYRLDSDTLYLSASGFEKYDSSGSIIEKTISNYQIDSDSLYLTSTDLERYNSLGRVIEKEELVVSAVNSWSRFRRFQYFYNGEYLDSMKRTTRQLDYSYSTFFYNRDSLGRLKQMVHRQKNPQLVVDGVKIDSSQFDKGDIIVDYEYDQYGNIISRKSSHNGARRFEYVFDHKNNWISKLEYRERGNLLIRKTLRQITYW